VGPEVELPPPTYPFVTVGEPVSITTGEMFFGRIATSKDADGKVTTYTYNANGDRITETDPLNHTTTYTC
jgi:YD repeat-containing protein